MTWDRWTHVDWSRRRLKGATFHFQVSLDVRFERLEVGVPQDVLDGHGGNTGLEHVHRFRVSETVRTDPLPPQRRGVANGKLPVVIEYKRGAGSGERLSTGVSEEPCQVAG